MKYPNMTWSRMQAVVDKLGGEEGVERFLRGELICTSASVLREVATISVPAVKLFVARGHFKADTTTSASVRIGFLGEKFKEHFLGRGEENIPATTVVLHQLLKSSSDNSILQELGDRAETSLAHLWHLLSQQGHGRPGPLLTDESWNIFYIRTDQKLWVVYVRWNAYYHYWHVRVDSVDSACAWDAGALVVSRK